MKHILFDFEKCSFDILDNELYIKFSLEGAAELAGCKILKVETHKFEPQGVTAICFISRKSYEYSYLARKRYCKV